MKDNYQLAIEFCQKKLDSKEDIGDKDIDEAVGEMKTVFTDLDGKKLKNDLLSKYSISIDIDSFPFLKDKKRNIKTWMRAFNKEKRNSEWKFWNRYTKYLKDKKKFSREIILDLDKITDKILDQFFDPLSEFQGSKKGLVVGKVQSGKTANYIGVICKAADLGFKLIIVLSGIHNSLRSQTQTRLDEGFLGSNTSGKKIGVGLIDDVIAQCLTSCGNNGDFDQKIRFNTSSKDTLLLVVKKNSNILNKLHNWLKNRPLIDKSLLIIDDEADNASINTNQNGKKPTAINRLICKIISLFNRSAYIGYTATPFANIFISPHNEKDLFPSDFIINIPAAKDYIGPEMVFGLSIDPDDKDDLLPIVFPIRDHDNFVPKRHKKEDDKPNTIPKSLEIAVKCFIVSCAIRIARRDKTKHNSMLIHVSRYQLWQKHIEGLVKERLNYYRNEIEADDNSTLKEFRQILEEDDENYKSYKTVTTEIKQSKKFDCLNGNMTVHSWEEIKPLLFDAVKKIEVKSINGSSKDCLSYYENEEGISVIVIGGDKLSRGLTLEGLSISYFLRASKMYDTLMQMGRWFGYHPGYVDLCRLFTSEELNEWYRHIAKASEELTYELDYMASIGKTPKDYALKVRNSPCQLQITSISKMRNTKEIKVSWSGRLIETYQLSMNKDTKKKNLNVTDNFISSLGKHERKKRAYLWRNVSTEKISRYIRNYEVPDNLKTVNSNLIIKYIEKLETNGNILSWSVALMTLSDNKNVTHTFSNKVKVNCFLRNHASDINCNTYLIKKNHIIGNNEDESIDLDDELLKKALEFTNEKKKTWDKEYPAPEIVRKKFRLKTNPLLLIYLLDPKGAPKIEEKTEEPFVGFAISFPENPENEEENAVSYTANMISEFEETENTFDQEK